MSGLVGPEIARRRLLALLAAPVFAESAHAAGKTLPLSRSLPQELAQALAMRQPLVVMASLHGCPWCKLVRENYLAPMHAEEALPVVQIDFGSAQATRDFAGQRTTHEALIRAWNITVAPTVLFFGAGGRELAERLPGASTDFYSAYLDRRLAAARKALAG